MTSNSSASILAVTGLAREAKIVARDHVRVVVGGGDARELARRMERAFAEGPVCGVISTGIAGALDSGLEVGDCVIASQIVLGEGKHDPDPRWTAALRAGRFEGLNVVSGAIAGRDVMAVSPDEKTALFHQTRAAAVDMESQVAMAAAIRHGVPFVAFRVISDRADQALPDAARVAMRHDGTINLFAVMRSVIGRPTQIPALIRTGRESGVAFANLGRALNALGPALGCPYQG